MSSRLSDQFDQFGEYIDEAISGKRLMISLLLGLGLTLGISFPEAFKGLEKQAIYLRDRAGKAFSNSSSPSSSSSSSFHPVQAGKTEIEGPFSLFEDINDDEELEDTFESENEEDDLFFNCLISDMGDLECYGVDHQEDFDPIPANVVESASDQFARQTEEYLQGQCLLPVFSYLPPVFYGGQAIFETDSGDQEIAG